MTRDLRMGELLRMLREVTVRHIQKWGSWTVSDQISHLHSEVSEVYQARRHGKGSGKILEEIWDIIFSAITLANVMGYSDFELLQSMENCVAKIRARVNLPA